METLFDYFIPPRRARWVLAVYWIALAVGSHWPKLSLFPPPETEPIFKPDKGLHFAAFAGLAWLMIRAKIVGRGAGVALTTLVVGCVALVYAGLDEMAQGWADRDVTFSDFAASAIGVLAVVIGSVAGLRQRPSPGRLRRYRMGVLIGTATILVLAVVPIVNDVIRWTVHQTPWPAVRIDKTCHLLAAMGMTWLLALAYPAGAHRPRLGVWVTILAIGLSAPMIEWAQSLTGRGVESADVYAHELGLFAAMAVWAIISTARAFHATGLTERYE